MAGVNVDRTRAIDLGGCFPMATREARRMITQAIDENAFFMIIRAIIAAKLPMSAKLVLLALFDRQGQNVGRAIHARG